MIVFFKLKNMNLIKGVQESVFAKKPIRISQMYQYERKIIPF